jgi:hypothetical protein
VLQLTIGGTLVVRASTATSPRPTPTSVLDTRANSRSPSLWNPTQPLQSLIAPGDYLLLAQAEGFVPQVLPFTIRSGGETVLTVTRAARRTPVDSSSSSHRARTVPRTSRSRCAARATLAASVLGAQQGRGTVRAAKCASRPAPTRSRRRTREPQKTATFTVGATEGRRARIELR